MITRIYKKSDIDSNSSGRAWVLYGPRRAGKTCLIETLLKNFPGKIFKCVGEDAVIRELLESDSVVRIQDYFGSYDIVFIDEAQKIDRIGQGLKLLVDHCKNTRVIVTGSSSFMLAQKVGEPLTGRKRTSILYPLSILELRDAWGGAELLRHLENLLIYGMYPDVVCAESVEARKRELIEIRNAYLLKDVLELDSIRNSKALSQLLTLLAFQIGNEVSMSELGQQVGMNKKTVERYLDILEKAFVIRRVNGFSRNLRKEISKSPRFYFYDNGVRNAVINNFAPIKLRNDVGQLWENFMVMERLKFDEYTERWASIYFWRTYDQQEIDFIEEKDGVLSAYEFEWSQTQSKVPTAWAKAYPQARFETIHRGNFLQFVTEEGKEAQVSRV